MEIVRKQKSKGKNLDAIYQVVGHHWFFNLADFPWSKVYKLKADVLGHLKTFLVEQIAQFDGPAFGPVENPDAAPVYGPIENPDAAPVYGPIEDPGEDADDDDGEDDGAGNDGGDDEDGPPSSLLY
jgi:hypothetical protein